MGKISTAEVLRLRATSAVSPDKSVRRCAQDDVLVGVLKKNTPDKLARMEWRPGLSSAVPPDKFSRPCGTKFVSLSNPIWTIGS
jgi:hypothetical protein